MQNYLNKEPNYKLDIFKISKEQLLNYFLLLYVMAQADNKYLPVEKEFIETQINEYPEVEEEIKDYINKFRGKNEEAKNKIISHVNSIQDYKYKIFLINSIRKIAIIDFDYAYQERDFLDQLSQIAFTEIQGSSYEELNNETKESLQDKYLISEIFEDSVENQILNKVKEDIKKDRITFNNFMEKYPFLFIRISAFIAYKNYGIEVSGFWESFKNTIENENFNTTKFGDHFIEILKKHNMLRYFPQLREKGPYKNVFKIVLHGGIPKKYLPKYFDALYEAVQNNCYDINSFVKRSYFPHTVENYFRYCPNYAREFYINTLKLINNNNIEIIKLPVVVIESYLDWKNVHPTKSDYLKQKIANIDCNNIFIAFDSLTHKIGLLTDYLKIDNCYNRILEISIEEHLVSKEVRIIKQVENSYLLKDEFIPFDENQIEHVLDNKLISVTHDKKLLTISNIFQGKEERIAFFKEYKDNKFIKVNKAHTQESSLILVPKDIVIKVAGISENIYINESNKSFNIIYFDTYKLLNNISLIDHCENILLPYYNIKNLIDEECPPYPFLTYKGAKIYSGKFKLNNLLDRRIIIERIDKCKRTILNNIIDYGEYVINGDQYFMYVPEFSINIDRENKKITFLSQNDRIAFNNTNILQIDYKNIHEKDYQINCQIDKKDYVFDYILPSIDWTITESDKDTNINSTETISIYKSGLHNKYLILKTANHEEIEGFYFNSKKIHIKKIHKTLYRIDLKTLISNVEESTRINNYIHLKTQSKNILLLKIISSWLISDIEYAFDKNTIVTSWKENYNSEE
ncbi:hypothetical protein ACFL2K_03800, partial [Candidatus Margulisiibacteriota bacterium]